MREASEANPRRAQATSGRAASERIENAKRGHERRRQPGAHRILDAAISAGLAPEGNLAIAERGNGRRNRPYKCGSTVAPFVTAIYNSIKASKQMWRVRLGAKSNMQSAVTNGADSRAHRIL